MERVKESNPRDYYRELNVAESNRQCHRRSRCSEGLVKLLVALYLLE
jgi:hypothetical protein